MRHGIHRLHLTDSSGPVIGGKTIGGGHRTYIIAEAGVNHNGQVDLAFKLVDAAKRCGADAVKFQAFTAEHLVIRNAPTATYQAEQGHSDQQAMLKALELKRDEFLRLREYCDSIGIEFLATPFSLPDLDSLLTVGVHALKLAGPDLVNVPLLERAMMTKLPVIASSGTCSMDEIESAVEVFTRHASLASLILMHCISAYPTKLADANLGVIHTLKSHFGVPVGFSDHTAETITGALAVAAGADVLEKHMTLDRSMAGPDHAFSMDEAMMTEYVALARQAYDAIGSGRREVLSCEREVRHVSRGSVVSLCEIRPGTVITPAMLCVKRPGGGIEPARLQELVGTVAVRPIAADTMIDWTMVQPAESLTTTIAEHDSMAW